MRGGPHIHAPLRACPTVAVNNPRPLAPPPHSQEQSNYRDTEESYSSFFTISLQIFRSNCVSSIEKISQLGRRVHFSSINPFMEP